MNFSPGLVAQSSSSDPTKTIVHGSRCCVDDPHRHLLTLLSIAEKTLVEVRMHSSPVYGIWEEGGLNVPPGTLLSHGQRTTRVRGTRHLRIYTLNVLNT